MSKWYRNPNWWLAIFTGLSLIIGSMGLYSGEYGPIFRETNIRLFPQNTISIGHNYGSLYLDLPVDIIKTGKETKSIYKMEAYLQRYDGKFALLFEWNRSPMTIYTNVSLKLNIRFFQEPDMEKYNNFYPLLEKVRLEINQEFKKVGDPNKAYFLKGDHPSVINLQNFVKELLKDFSESKYKILFLAWEDEKRNKPLWNEAYVFEFSKSQRDILLTDQLKSYDSTDDFNPRFIKYWINSFIDKIPKSEADKLFEAYKSYSSRKL